MKYFFHSCLIVAGLLIMLSCNNRDLYEQKLKTLDSLSGALNTMVATLGKPDSARLHNLVTRFNHYSHFIEQNIHDTIDKAAADQLQHFYIGGKGIESFLQNRSLIFSRARLMNSQHRQLAEDIRNRNIPAGDAGNYVAHEYKEAAALIATANSQQQKYYHCIEEYRHAIAEVEKLILSRNNGQLPAIIQESNEPVTWP